MLKNSPVTCLFLFFYFFIFFAEVQGNDCVRHSVAGVSSGLYDVLIRVNIHAVRGVIYGLTVFEFIEFEEMQENFVITKRNSV